MTPVVGILGGGQLGRMLALAGIPLGLRFRFLEPTAECPAAPTGQVVVGGYDDPAALARFAEGLTVATYEFENVPAATARWLTEHVPVYPPEGVLAIAQDRLSEKTLFRELGIGTPEFVAIDGLEDLLKAAARLGFPCVLKTRRLGYDGKGQTVLRSIADVQSLGEIGSGLILEAFVPFKRELSIIAARSRSGELAFFPLTQNTHREGILRESIAPAPGLTPDEQSRAESIITRVLDRTGYVGVLAVELFELADGSLLANEMAPRVHNSGHWTQNGAPVSQFELHIRAILDWPLHPPTGGAGEFTRVNAAGHAAMLNLLRGRPSPERILSLPGAALHLYGKQSRPGELRKIGHVNITAPDEQTLRERVTRCRGALADLL